MRSFSKAGGLAFAVAIIASGSAMAQGAYNYDAYCRQYADSAVAPMRNQAAAQGVGSALVGAGLGAALGAAAGGGRGAGIGAASGAIVGTGVGVANAQYSDAAIAQQYNAYYYQCMQQYSQPQPSYPQGYGPQPQPYGYSAPYGYAPR
jgi:uncharacterized protein YcfJ